VAARALRSAAKQSEPRRRGIDTGHHFVLEGTGRIMLVSGHIVLITD
jgi:hypothetical protein